MQFLLDEILPVARDIAVIILAVESIVIGLVVLFVLLQVWKLIGIAKRQSEKLTAQASEILGTTGDTVRNVKGTTTFVSDRAAKPVIEAVSIISAVRDFARAAFGTDKNGRRPD